MANGICIYAENTGNILEPIVAELVTAARQISEKTGEPVQAMLVAEDCRDLIRQLKSFGIDEIYAVETKSGCLFHDDSVSRVICQILKRVEPSAVLIPASVNARSIFSRAAVLLGSGLTADCTDLEVVKDETGDNCYIKQNKPSFGDNVMVSIITKKCRYPQMMTIRQGVYTASVGDGPAKAQVYSLNDVEIPKSQIEVLEIVPCEEEADSVSSARIVCVAGRGVLEDENFTLLREFAAKIGGAVAGTRPLADEGIIPFENQIGQTGKTIRPHICVSFGVSGAIQHTEGIKDAKLFIAVNSDESAAIFNVSDYGAVADMHDILTSVLSMTQLLH